MIEKLPAQKLNDLLNKNITIVDVYASWCGPCKMLSPVIEEITNKMDIELIKVNIDENLDVASEYQISSIPTLMLFKDKKIVSIIVGYHDIDQLEKWIEDYK